jgi:hypothetical protein
LKGKLKKNFFKRSQLDREIRKAESFYVIEEGNVFGINLRKIHINNQNICVKHLLYIFGILHPGTFNHP